MIDIKAQIIGAEKVAMRLLDAGPKTLAAVRTEVERLGLEIQRAVKEKRLTGPRPTNLGVKTGRLRRSINLAVTEQAQSVMGSVGTNVAYARRWELGGSWSENVRAHVRKVRFATTKDGRLMTQGDRIYGPATRFQSVALVFAKKSQKLRVSEMMAKVKPFTRNVTVKARPFLKPVLEEMRNPIRARLAKAVAAVAGGK